MAKQTVVALPNDVTEAAALKQVLSKVIEELDKLIGNRGSSPVAYASQVTAATASIATLADKQEVKQLSTMYRDFASTAWMSLSGVYQLAALGSDLSNTPFTAAPASEYLVYAVAYTTKSTGKAVVFLTVVEDLTTTMHFTLVGSTWV